MPAWSHQDTCIHNIRAPILSHSYDLMHIRAPTHRERPSNTTLTYLESLAAIIRYSINQSLSNSSLSICTCSTCLKATHKHNQVNQAIENNHFSKTHDPCLHARTFRNQHINKYVTWTELYKHSPPPLPVYTHMPTLCNATQNIYEGPGTSAVL